jgi:hypothetical protein
MKTLGAMAKRPARRIGEQKLKLARGHDALAADQLDDPPVKLTQRNRHRIAATRTRAPRGVRHADLQDRDPPLQSGAR